jgi:hypothetical protein
LEFRVIHYVNIPGFHFSKDRTHHRALHGTSQGTSRDSSWTKEEERETSLTDCRDAWLPK